MVSGWDDLNRMFEAFLLKGRLDEFYRDLGRSFGMPSELAAYGYFPRLNLTDLGDSLEVVAELPGVKKENLQVKILGNYLEISGTIDIGTPELYTLHRRERKTSQFSRSLTLPSDVAVNKVKATLNNGLLTLEMPKAEEAKPQQIPIN